jgi:hypothetical protein
MILGVKIIKPENLGQWLEVATYDLVAPAKERIRVEIEAHYAEAVASHMANGISQTQAELAALAELGDAPTAGNKFRKQYLTESEVSGDKSVVKMARRWSYLLLHYALGIILCSILLLHDKYTDPAFAGVIILLVVSPTISFIIARRQSVKSNPRRPPIISYMNVMSIWLVLLISTLGPSGESGVGLFVAIGLCIYFFLVCYQWLRWQQKRKQTWPEVPPQDTALS